MPELGAIRRFRAAPVAVLRPLARKMARTCRCDPAELPIERDMLRSRQVGSRTVSVRTLIVEDSVSARSILTQRLTAIGCQIVAMASDSATALELVRELHPQLVTLDLIMPETGSLNAEQLFRMIRKEMPEVAVVVISARSKAALRAHFLRQGAIEFFQKPFFDFDALAEKLSRIFPDIKPPSRIPVRPSAKAPSEPKPLPVSRSARCRSALVRVLLGRNFRS
jgi:two-component system chemotaxis response regulator CheY